MKPIRVFSVAMVVALAVAFSIGFPVQAEGAKALKGTATGVVLNEMNKPVPNTAVYYFQRDWSNTDGFGQPDWRILAGKTTTNKSGKYTISLPAGEYKVWFVPTNLELYAMEGYPDSPVVRLGDVVTLRYGKTTTGVSAILNTPGVITGTLYDTAPGFEGVPLANIHVSLSIQDYSIKNVLLHTDTDENGVYRFTGMKPYPWELWFNSMASNNFGDMEAPLPPNYTDAYKSVFVNAFEPYTWKPAPGTTETIRDWNLETIDFVNIRGQILYHDSDTGTDEPAAGLWVAAFYADNPWDTRDWVDQVWAQTDSDGYFEIKGSPGAYARFVLYVNGAEMFYSEYFDNAQSPWGAVQTDLVMGEPVDIGQWWIHPIETNP